jgi:hypothetical protein
MKNQWRFTPVVRDHFEGFSCLTCGALVNFYDVPFHWGEHLESEYAEALIENTPEGRLPEDELTD